MEKSCTIAIRAIPNAPRNEVVGWMADGLKVKVHAPALDGRANDELCAYLAAELGLPRRAVTLLQGARSRRKVVRIAGLAAQDLRARWASPS